MDFLAANLKLIRKKKWKLSQERFADLLNSSRSKINSYENGGIEPSIEFMLLLAQYSGVDIRELVQIELEIDRIPESPLNSSGEAIFNEAKPDYGLENDNELIVFNHKLKDRFKKLEDRVSGLEARIKDQDQDIE